jgi:hypothetical protein
MTNARNDVLRRISDLLNGRPVRWAQDVVGDYDGRDRTLEIEAYWDPYWVRFRSAVTVSFLQTELGALSGHILLAFTGHRGR